MKSQLPNAKSQAPARGRTSSLCPLLGCVSRNQTAGSGGSERELHDALLDLATPACVIAEQTRELLEALKEKLARRRPLSGTHPPRVQLPQFDEQALVPGAYLPLARGEPFRPFLGAFEHLHLEQRRSHAALLVQEPVGLAAKLAHLQEAVHQGRTNILDF